MLWLLFFMVKGSYAGFFDFFVPDQVKNLTTILTEDKLKLIDSITNTSRMKRFEELMSVDNMDKFDYMLNNFRPSMLIWFVTFLILLVLILIKKHI